MQVTEERFRALARSSPWRWSSLRFVRTEQPERDRFGAGVRAWLRRPGALRVEDLDGRVLQTESTSGPRTVGLFTSEGAREVIVPWPSAVSPVVGPDGLVRERLPELEVAYDDPMFRDVAWVAMLDPIELADGDAGVPGTALEDLRPVEHHGRDAWEATVRPTSAYTPRCSCCPLLWSEQSFRRLAEEGGPASLDDLANLTFPDAHEVRLDVETGVCVHVAQVGGDHDGRYEDLHIEQVDEPMPDPLFVDRPRH